MQRGSALVTLGYVYAGLGSYFTMFVVEGLFRFSSVSAFALSMVGGLVTFIIYVVIATIGEKIEDKSPLRRPRSAALFPGFFAWLLLVIALIVSFAVWFTVRRTTPDTSEQKAQRYWAEIKYHAEETKDVEAQRQLAKQIVAIGPEAYPVVIDIIRRGPYGREAVDWWVVLRSMGSEANDYLSAEIERAARGPRTESRWQSTDSEILWMITAQLIAFDDWRYFELWLLRGVKGKAGDSLQIVDRLIKKD